MPPGQALETTVALLHTALRAVRSSSSSTSSLSRDNSVVASSLVSGAHGRERRAERHIKKSALQMARRYGMREVARYGREKYTYGGVTFIYSPQSNHEVTSYRRDNQGKHPAASSGAAEKLPSGTLSTLPILLSKKYEYDTPEMLQRHEALCSVVARDPNRWLSHSVLVVDMSGSMRRDDVDGARCRSDGVWMALARDFVKEQLEEGGTAAAIKEDGLVDVVSVVLMMNDGADIVLQAEPMDWVLYNKFIDFREWTSIKPAGHGYYLPALDKAEELLKSAGGSGSCALALLFFSDGRPSDFIVNGKHLSKKGVDDASTEIARRMGRIAAKYGPRLSVQCIGMASAGENPDVEFQTLQKMVDEAALYGVAAALDIPRLTQSTALSCSIRSLLTSMTQSKTALTNPATGMLRRVRTDVVREKTSLIGVKDTVLTKDWQAYHNGSQTHYVQRFWTWDRRRDDFVYVMDPRCIYCYALIEEGCHVGKSGSQCPDCKACYICDDCKQGAQRGPSYFEHRGSDDCRFYLEDRRSKAMVRTKAVPSFSVAMKNYIFGEGVERIVRRFRYLDDSNNFVGPAWVAKESRFVDENESTYESRMEYHREFMRTQVLARAMATKFNEALDNLTLHFDPALHERLKNLPRIRFVEPLVVELVECGSKKTFLVEEMLDGRYQKFNNNMGFVHGKTRGKTAHADQSDDDLVLDNIPEEDEEACDDPDEQLFRRKSISPQDTCHYANVRVEDFPQAFSHFSYYMSKGRIMVVDLQGVLQAHKNGLREYVLTDPAIHKRQQRKLGHLRLGHFGRTDRGEKGMKAFWASHVCTDACSLLGLVQEIL